MRAALPLAGWAFLGALPWILLQLGHSYVLFTRYDYHLLGQGGYLNPLHSRWIDTLFSSWHGFLSWTPVAYVAVIGTVRLPAARVALGRVGAGHPVPHGLGQRRHARLGRRLVVRRPTLHQRAGDAGARAGAGDRVRAAPAAASRWRRCVAGAIWWNHLLMVQYTAGMLPKDEPVSFGRIVRQQAELQTRPPYWYPFAFPANVWFAWREGVPVDKYDVLSPETPRADVLARVRSRGGEVPALGMGRAGWRRLGPGVVDWRQPGADGGAAGSARRRRDDHGPVAHAIRGAAGRRGDGARCQRRRSRPVQGGRAGCHRRP